LNVEQTNVSMTIYVLVLRVVIQSVVYIPTTSQPWGWGQRWSSKRCSVHRSTTRAGW